MWLREVMFCCYFCSFFLENIVNNRDNLLMHHVSFSSSPPPSPLYVGIHGFDTHMKKSWYVFIWLVYFFAIQCLYFQYLFVEYVWCACLNFIFLVQIICFLCTLVVWVLLCSWGRGDNFALYDVFKFSLFFKCTKRGFFLMLYIKCTHMFHVNNFFLYI